MIGSDVALAYVDGYLGYVDDYNITSRSPCSGVVGVKKGVCRDTVVEGGDNNQIQVKIQCRGQGLFVQRTANQQTKTSYHF